MIPSFPDGSGLPHRRLRVCIVTFELVGLWKNGGIGTVSTGLAELLAAGGHDVTVAYTRADLLDPEAFAEAARRYSAQGIRVVPLRRDTIAPTCGALDGFTGWERFAAYEFLSREEFDVVHASEHLGELFYCIAAKRLGLRFQNTIFWVGCHGPSHWVIEANDEAVRDAFWLWTDATERFCLANSDVVWAPSRYLLGWMRDNDYELAPGRTYQQQYRIPDDLGPLRDPPGTSRDLRHKVTELVFFGRLETRKGIKLFLDALAVVGSELKGISITFMGRVGVVDGEATDSFIARRAAQMGFEWQILSSFDRFEAYQYMKGPGRLAVAAAPVDNSPCAVYELLEVGARFIACNGGGVPELVAPESHDAVLFDYTLASIVERLRHSLTQGSIAPRPAMERARSDAAWLGAHLALTPARADAGQPAATGAAVVALVQYDNDLAALNLTVAALTACGTAVSEILILQSDRRGVLPASAHPALTRLSLDSIGMGAVLEALVARDAPVLLLRAGATLVPKALARLAAAVRRADAVVPFAMLDAGGRACAELTLPGCESWATLYGCARTGGVISADALRRLVGQTVPGSDMLLLFDLAMAQGLTVLPLAEPLLDGRRVDRTTQYVPDERARLTLWAGRAPAHKRLMIEAAYGLIVRPYPAPGTAAPTAPSDKDIARYRTRLASRSFRFGRAVTRLLGRSSQLPQQPASVQELVIAESAILGSVAWKCGAPLRLARRILRRH
ncbi:MAG: glycosyl transferase family 2 [Rubritepida sp.]|nr:glycosyl transferase family 2 [Rubritepida sp.]